MAEVNMITVISSQAACFIIGIIWGRIMGHRNGWQDRIKYQEELDDAYSEESA